MILRPVSVCNRPTKYRGRHQPSPTYTQGVGKGGYAPRMLLFARSATHLKRETRTKDVKDQAPKDCQLVSDLTSVCWFRADLRCPETFRDREVVTDCLREFVVGLHSAGLEANARRFESVFKSGVKCVWSGDCSRNFKSLGTVSADPSPPTVSPSRAPPCPSRSPAATSCPTRLCLLFRSKKLDLASTTCNIRQTHPISKINGNRVVAAVPIDAKPFGVIPFTLTEQRVRHRLAHRPNRPASPVRAVLLTKLPSKGLTDHRPQLRTVLLLDAKALEFKLFIRRRQFLGIAACVLTGAQRASLEASRRVRWNWPPRPSPRYIHLSAPRFGGEYHSTVILCWSQRRDLSSRCCILHRAARA